MDKPTMSSVGQYLDYSDECDRHGQSGSLVIRFHRSYNPFVVSSFSSYHINVSYLQEAFEEPET